MVSRPAASANLGHIKNANSSAHSRPTESETGAGPRTLYFERLKNFWCTLKENKQTNKQWFITFSKPPTEYQTLTLMLCILLLSLLQIFCMMYKIIWDMDWLDLSVLSYDSILGKAWIV